MTHRAPNPAILPPYAGYPPIRPRNGLGIASLVLAITALLSVWSVVGGIVLGVVAAVLGFVARRRVKRGEANNGGVAIAAIVLAIMAVIVGMVFAGVWVVFWQEADGDNYVDCLQQAGPDRVRAQQCADQFRDKVQDKFGVTVRTPPSAPKP
ncbi:DUF4190 domain-containing protein [Mycobacterium sp.]|uniref:DUF4190 domain-containing protein n=1 Tax=Mycobacterium sp. TaxID=1785 RepID=UPI003D6A0912